MGPNGAGKSTLLRTLAGFQAPLSGEIIINGKSLNRIPGKEVSSILSVVLTERPSIENLSVEQLVGLGRSPYTGFFGRMSKEDHRIVSEAIALAGIDDLRHRNAATLSDGERQKVMIAKALAQQTEIIILDEPTAFLDYPSKVETMLLLQRLCQEEGKSVFMSTHDLEIALQVSDKIWLMSKQYGISTGTRDSLNESGVIDLYFKTPGLNFDGKRFNITTNPKKVLP